MNGQGELSLKDSRAAGVVAVIMRKNQGVNVADVSPRGFEAALEEENATIIPTVKLSSVESAYWCRMGGKEFLRWAQTVDDDALLDGLARLHAKRASAIGDARFIGAFRACGIVIPVWELPRGTEAADIEDAVAEYWPRFAEALGSTEPLTADERRARGGLVARQVTLR